MTVAIVLPRDTATDPPPLEETRVETVEPSKPTATFPGSSGGTEKARTEIVGVVSTRAEPKAAFPPAARIDARLEAIGSPATSFRPVAIAVGVDETDADPSRSGDSTSLVPVADAEPELEDEADPEVAFAPAAADDVAEEVETVPLAPFAPATEAEAVVELVAEPEAALAAAPLALPVVDVVAEPVVAFRPVPLALVADVVAGDAAMPFLPVAVALVAELDVGDPDAVFRPAPVVDVAEVVDAVRATAFFPTTVADPVEDVDGAPAAAFRPAPVALVALVVEAEPVAAFGDSRREIHPRMTSTLVSVGLYVCVAVAETTFVCDVTDIAEVVVPPELAACCADQAPFVESASPVQVDGDSAAPPPTTTSPDVRLAVVTVGVPVVDPVPIAPVTYATPPPELAAISQSAHAFATTAVPHESAIVPATGSCETIAPV